MRPRALLIEDEPDIVELVRYNFTKEGFDVLVATRGQQGLEMLRREQPDLVLLDVMLPDVDGLELCRRIRADERTQFIPVILVTAKSEEVDRIVGLELGGDDYVTKPFSPRELVARAKAVLRRNRRDAEKPRKISIGALELDPGAQEVTVRGQPVSLSSLEFRLLHFLASHPRQIFSRERLLDQVWGADSVVTARTVDVHVRRLREKIERQADQPEYIQTVRGAGYRFAAGPEP